MREKAILVGLSLPFQDGELLEECLDELARLADTAGAEVLGRVVQRRERIDPAYYIGRGKAEEISAKAKDRNAALGSLAMLKSGEAFVKVVEVFVAFIQAFIFTFLTVVFIGQAISHEGEHAEAEQHRGHGVEPAVSA